MMETRGHVLHSALGYDLVAWLFLRGRERAFRERLVALARLEPGERVLDVGCGTGSLAIAAKRRVGPSGSVHGIDPSPELLARARKKARRAGVEVTFASGVVEAIPFPAASFDVVTSTLMLHHLPVSMRQPSLREMSRVLRPGGRVLAVDFGVPRGDRLTFIERLHRRRRAKLPDVEELARAAGLEILEGGPVGLRNLSFVLARVAC